MLKHELQPLAFAEEKTLGDLNGEKVRVAAAKGQAYSSRDSVNPITENAMRPRRNRTKHITAVACGLMLTCVAAVAQGTILFQNIGPGFDAPIRMPDGSLVPVGQNFFAELLAGTSPGSITSFTPIIARQFVMPGYFGIGTPESVTLGFAPGSHPWFIVRVFHMKPSAPFWVLDPTIYGVSTPFQLGAPGGLGDPIGVPPTPGPPLFGMQGFTLVPEPSMLVLLIVGAAMLLPRRRFP